MTTLTEGMELFIHTGGGASHSCVVSESCVGRVDILTDKAVKLLLSPPEGRTWKAAPVWIPRKALTGLEFVDLGKGGYYACALAQWFQPGGYQADVIERYSSLSGVAAP